MQIKIHRDYFDLFVVRHFHGRYKIVKEAQNSARNNRKK